MWMEDLDMTFDTSRGYSLLVYPLYSTADQSIAVSRSWSGEVMHMVSMVEVKGWLSIRSFTFVFLVDSDDEEMIRDGIRGWLTGDKTVRTAMESYFTFCGEMELMNPEEIFAPPANTILGNMPKNWQHIWIRARCPVNVDRFAPRSIVVVHGAEMPKNVKMDIRWALESYLCMFGACTLITL